MKLYLARDVKAKAYARFGGPEGLEAELEKREQRKWEGLGKKGLSGGPIRGPVVMPNTRGHSGDST